MSGVRAPIPLYVFMLCIATLYIYIYIYTFYITENNLEMESYNKGKVFPVNKVEILFKV